LTLYALLDSPSCAGAYKITIMPGDTTVTEIEAVLFPRRDIETLGIAPLTSMFLFGPADDRGFDDFRPEVHDSDGLSMHSGAGEWIWRPLRNPAQLQVNAFSDDNPRGFGLMQSARDFASYQDLEAHYEKRPSVWVEPLAGWGQGQIRLVEIPTDLEIHDNIVAFWVPGAAVAAGSEWRVNYRLHWGLTPAFVSDRGRVIKTRHGAGGVSGTGEGSGNRKFVIDFKGGPLDSLAPDAAVEAVVSASAGTILFPVAQQNEETGGWRAFFDLEPAGDGPVELRCFLRLDGDALTETWSFQWIP
jgi:glucans biosynthesis protein